MSSVAETKRTLDQALAALAEPGAGARSTLECRVADLEERVIAIPCRDLADIEARLTLIHALALPLGDGYLRQVVAATLADVRALLAASDPAPGREPEKEAERPDGMMPSA